jgi:vanillate O-demethylase ferredoxin subunit
VQTLDVIVHSISLTSAISRSYELRAAAGGALPSFEAGAHIDVHLGPSLVRPYSLCNSPQDNGRYLIRVRRDDAGRGGSRTLHHYTSSAAEAPLLERLRTSASGERTVIHHSDQGASIRTGLPAELLAPEPDTAVSVCGPDGFMTHVVTEATAAGRQPGQLHTERFAPAAGQAAADDVATEFTTRPSTGIGYPVPADRTIADVLTAHGVEVELSCEQGVCGACLTPVPDGEPDHRDEVQTPDERAAGDRITICCSRARTPELLLGL